MRIAVYSGSFDPLHIGHLAIMEHLSRGEEFDLTYLVVSPQNPLKSRENIGSADRRLAAAVEAVRRHPELKVRVDDIEFALQPPHYTINTLDALREREPDNEFTLVIGADSLAGIGRWRDWRRILCEYGVAVYPRRGYDLDSIRRRLDEETGLLCRIKLTDAPMVDISSTEIRRGIAEGRDVTQFLM